MMNQKYIYTKDLCLVQLPEAEATLRAHHHELKKKTDKQTKEKIDR